MSTYEIPLSANPQSLSISLAGTIYQLTVRWNTFTNTWVMDIANQSGVLIVSCVPLVTGANLLQQYDYLAFGGDMFAFTDRDLDAPPTFDNLGTVGHLYFFVP